MFLKSPVLIGQPHNTLIHFSQRINYDFDKHAEINNSAIFITSLQNAQHDIKIPLQEFILKEEYQKGKTKTKTCHYQQQKGTPSTKDTQNWYSTQHSTSKELEQLSTSN